MTFNQWLLSFIGGSLLLAHTAIAAPGYTTSPGSVQDRRPMTQQAPDGLSKLRHELSNHESEIRMMEEKLNNHEETLDNLRQSLLDNGQLHKDLLKDNSSNINSKIDALETKTKGLVADFAVLKTHANESSAILAQYKQRINELDKIAEAQKNQLNHLEAAVRSLMDLLQDSPAEKPLDKSDSTKIYRVQSGDTLEKIARSQKTTIQALRERNNLTQDKIVIGQKLIIP